MAEVGGENTTFYGHQAMLASAAPQGAVGIEVPEEEEEAQAGLTAPPPRFKRLAKWGFLLSV